MTLVLWTVVIAVLTAMACSLCGTFLVVKREAFISEGLSHAVLPGMVLSFALFQDRNQAGLIAAAALSGLLMVWLVRRICATNLVEHDCALGIVFSGLFSIGIIISNLKLRNIHFHAHCIIDGNLALAALVPFKIGDTTIAPRAAVVMGVILLLVIAFIVLFFKELKLMSFDETLSQMLGFRPALLHTVWLGLVSMTTVAAFDTAGTVLVVALMIAPPAAANLLTNRLSLMLVLSALIGAAGAVVGIYLGIWLDISPAGPIASTVGFMFLLTALFAPTHGYLAKLRTRQRQRGALLERLVLQIVNDSPEESIDANELVGRIATPKRATDSAVAQCLAQDRIRLSSSGTYVLTEHGSSFLAGAEL